MVLITCGRRHSAEAKAAEDLFARQLSSTVHQGGDGRLVQ
jgi:hypothetical protein